MGDRLDIIEKRLDIIEERLRPILHIMDPPSSAQMDDIEASHEKELVLPHHRPGPLKDINKKVLRLGHERLGRAVQRSAFAQGMEDPSSSVSTIGNDVMPLIAAHLTSQTPAHVLQDEGDTWTAHDKLLWTQAIHEVRAVSENKRRQAERLRQAESARVAEGSGGAWRRRSDAQRRRHVAALQAKASEHLGGGSHLDKLHKPSKRKSSKKKPSKRKPSKRKSIKTKRMQWRTTRVF